MPVVVVVKNKSLPKHDVETRKFRVSVVLQCISSGSELVAIHDSARPLVTQADAARCFEDGLEVGAPARAMSHKPAKTLIHHLIFVGNLPFLCLFDGPGGSLWDLC